QNYTDSIVKAFNSHYKSNSSSPAFSEFYLREVKLNNRIVMSSMGQYSALDGVVNDWHFQHYTSRAIGGVGLIITEMTASNPSGKITEACSGIYNENQIHNWKKIVAFIHKNTSSKIATQLGHPGGKGAIKKPWATNNESTEHRWELISASAI